MRMVSSPLEEGTHAADQDRARQRRPHGGGGTLERRPGARAGPRDGGGRGDGRVLHGAGGGGISHRGPHPVAGGFRPPPEGGRPAPPGGGGIFPPAGGGGGPGGGGA